MKLIKKLIPALTAIAILSVPMSAQAYGYQFLRKSVADKWQGVNGFITLPQYYASSPTTQTYPELFYGFYNSQGGFDFGIGAGINGSGWRIFFYGTNSVYSSNYGWSEANHTIPNVGPGTQLQIQTAIVPSGGSYKAVLDVYKAGTWIDGWSVPINYAWASNWMTNGGTINRELNVASNSTSSVYTKSGVYMYNAKSGPGWLIKNINDSKSWYAWTPARTSIAPKMHVDGEPGVLPNPNYYSTSSGTDANGYAIDSVNIDFRN